MFGIEKDYHIDINEDGPYTIFQSGETLNYTERIEGTFMVEPQYNERKEVAIEINYPCLY